MQLANQLELCLHEQTQIVASAACRVSSQEFHSWIASLPLVSLLFIVIPTLFLNLYIYICTQYTSAKVGIKFRRCARGCVLFVYGCSSLAAIVFVTQFAKTWHIHTFFEIHVFTP